MIMSTPQGIPNELKIQSPNMAPESLPQASCRTPVSSGACVPFPSLYPRACSHLLPFTHCAFAHAGLLPGFPLPFHDWQTPTDSSETISERLSLEKPPGLLSQSSEALTLHRATLDILMFARTPPTTVTRWLSCLPANTVGSAARSSSSLNQALKQEHYRDSKNMCQIETSDTNWKEEFLLPMHFCYLCFRFTAHSV